MPPPTPRQYTKEEVEGLNTTIHFSSNSVKDKFALGAITLIRRTFDLLSGYTHVPGAMTSDKYLVRAIFLETIVSCGRRRAKKSNPQSLLTL